MNKAIDWDKFKSEAKGLNLERPKQGYISLCELLNKNNHTLLSEYITGSTKVLIDFNCGHEPHWIRPSDYKQGIRCPKCKNNCPKQAKEFLLKLVKKNNHKLLSEHVNAKTKVLIDFNCGHEPNWIRPGSYKQGQRCPKCKTEYILEIRHKQAKEYFLKMIEINDHKLFGEYINASTKVLIDFKCGHKPHWIRPHSYKQGQRCPRCKNKGEAILHKLLLDMFEKVETQKTYEDLKDKKKLQYDFYIPEHNLLIELDGDHHREKVTYKTKDMTELEKYLEEIKANERLQNRQRKDKLKNDYAKDNNILLLRIEYVKGIVELDKWKKLIEDKIKEINLC